MDISGNGTRSTNKKPRKATSLETDANSVTCSMSEIFESIVRLVSKHDGINDKAKLSAIVAETFNLIQDRSVFYSDDFAIRFSSSQSENFSNTVLSLSNLQKVDDRPFLVCLVTPQANYLLLANSTLLRKVSHSSHELRENNIRGSFNGSDIRREFDGIANTPENFERLYRIHESIGFDGNLLRLVEATGSISPTGRKYEITEDALKVVMEAPARAQAFMDSEDALKLKHELDTQVARYRNEILVASLIENVNVRGRIIEFLIAGQDEQMRRELIDALRDGGKGMPHFKTENSLGDHTRSFPEFTTQTDVKTKIMVLDSNPKAYNLDKMLEFLALQKSVFMFYFIGVDPDRIVNTVLVSMFQKDLLSSTILLKHWAGRNSRGVTQFEGKTISRIILYPNSEIDSKAASAFLSKVIAL